MQETKIQPILNKITTAQASTMTMNAGELYLAPDTAVYSVNNVAPVNGNVTLSIPSEVTETTVSGWGFTKNVGTVTKVNNVSPVNGNVTLSIPTVDQTYNASSANAQSGVAIAGAKFLKNKSTNTAGTSYIIGGTASGVSNAVCVGSGASTSAYSVVVGQGASSTALYSTAVGSTADSNSQFGTAIGYAAKARATSAIQLGTGTNTDANTLSIGFSDAGTNYQLLDGSTGFIPDARLSSNIARTSAIPTESTVSGWGFTKNIGTVTSVNNVSPVNGNVTLSIPSKISDLTDDTSTNPVSNATVADYLTRANIGSATEPIYLVNGAPTICNSIPTQASDIGAQEALVSGTNIKTINSTSLLGSGDIAVLQNSASGSNSLSIGQSTNRDNIVTVGVSASANTGGVAIGYDATAGAGVAIGNGAITSGGVAVGDGASSNVLNAIQIGKGTNNDSSTLAIGFNGTNYTLLDGTTGLIPDARLNNLKFDGQWVGATATLCQGRTSETGNDKSFDVSSYLPSDSNNYEVLLTGAVTTGTTSGNQARVNLKSSIISDIIVICNAQTRTSSSVTAYGSCTLAVGTDREVIVQGWSNNTGAYSLWLRGYRRIGTNS